MGSAAPVTGAVLLLFLAARVSGVNVRTPRHSASGKTSALGAAWHNGILKIPLVTGAGRSGTHSVAIYLNKNGINAVHEGIAPGAVSVSWFYAAFTDRPYTLREIQAPFHKISLPSRSAVYKEFLPEMAAETFDGGRMRSLVRRNTLTDLQNITIQFSPIVHIMREPLHAINSLAWCLCPGGHYTKGGKYADTQSFRFAQLHVGSLGTTRMERAATYWLKWNMLCRRNTHETFAIESVGGGALLEKLGIRHNSSLPPLHETRVAGNSKADERERDACSWPQLERDVGPEAKEGILQRALEVGYNYSGAAAPPGR